MSGRQRWAAGSRSSRRQPGWMRQLAHRMTGSMGGAAKVAKKAIMKDIQERWKERWWGRWNDQILSTFDLRGGRSSARAGGVG